jgi:hypothetical protein
MAPTPPLKRTKADTSANRETLLKTDGRAVTFTAEKDGKIRINCGAWDETTKVLEPGQIIEVRWIEGQVHLIRVS